MSNTFIYYSRLSIKEQVDIDSLKPHVEDTNRKCSCCKEVFVISKNFEFDEQICNECYKKNQPTLLNLVICLCFGLIMHFTEFSEIYVIIGLRVLRSKNEKSLNKFGYIDMKKHNSLIELLIAEKARYNNTDDNI